MMMDGGYTHGWDLEDRIKIIAHLDHTQVHMVQV